METAANRQLADACSLKHFTIDDAFLPCEFDVDLAPGSIHIGGCAPVELPFIRPCFKLRWGDGSSDNIETDDVEVLCLTAWNPYSNVTLKDVTVFVILLDEAGNPPETLPDGTSSVDITPNSMICFGDIGPCDEKGNNVDSIVSREVVLVSRGAIPGTYFVFLGYCYGAEFSMAFGSTFPIQLVRS